MKPAEFLNELSNKKLGDYKTAAGADATAADKEGDYKRGDKRMSGIIKATKKEFANDAKKLKEFAPVGGDDREPDEEEILRQLAAKWWLGTEQEMSKAQKTLAAMGWEIGQDESGDDDAGVFVIRAGDENGDSYIAFNHSELEELNEAFNNYHANRTGFSRGQRDDERHDLDTPKPTSPEVWGLKINGKVWSKGGKDVTFTSKQAALNTRNAILKNKPDLEIGLVTKGGVAEDAMNEGVPSDNDMGVVPDVRSGTSTKMTLGQWKQMWLKKMPHADQGMFRYPPAMKGSFIAYFDGWENTPGARWDPQQSVSEEQLDELKCWSGYHRVAGTKAGFPGSCAKNKTNEQGVAEGSDFFAGSKFADEEGNTFSVEKIIAFAKKNPKYFRKDFPLSKIKHDLSWWQGNKERMMNADTSFPLLVIQNDDGHLGVADGLNRMKKAVDVEKKQTIDVYLVPKKDIMKFSEKQGVEEAYHSENCPHCGGEMVSEELMNEKKDACYYKVKSRYKVWPSAYASGALVKCRNKGAKNWGNGGKKNESVAGDDDIRPQGKILKKLHDIAYSSPTLTFQNFRQSGKEDIITDAIMACKVLKHYYLQNKNQPTAQIIHNLENELDDFRRGRKLDTPDGNEYTMDLSDLMQRTLGKMRFQQKVDEDQIDEKWTKKYKDSINCSNPKGFSQKAHCAGKQKNESSILEGINRVDESLHDWFNKEKWVRMDTKGNIKGPCAKEPGEGKPKCLPQAKAHSLGKKGRASAAARKRREDPNPDRTGKAINVNTKKKSNENIDEDWRKKLGAAALTGAMALGAAGASADNTRRVTPDGQGGFTGGLKPSATVVAPDNTPSATPPTASSDTSDPFKGLARAESADRQAQTITVGGKEYRMVEISPTDIRPRSGRQIVVPQAVLGERSIGNYMGILTGNTVFVISK